VNPLAEFAVSMGAAEPLLTFRNLGEEAGLGRTEAYEYQWFDFDNATGALRPLEQPRTASGTALAMPAPGAGYRMARIRSRAAEPAWRKAVDVFLRGGAVVGVDRER
jgi:hypothetical protein